MAISNGKFTGTIEGKTIKDYSGKLDYSIENLEKRKEEVSKILNLDKIGSKDAFWMEVWDMANCKVSLNKIDALWTESNIAQLLESIGTYLIVKDESDVKQEKKRFNRPKKETAIDADYSAIEYDVVKNDKNYRLDPPETIKNSDFKLRNIFSRDYNYYKDVIYPRYINGLKEKIVKESIERHGHHDGVFEDFSCSKLMDEETWDNLKRLELQKIEFLKDARDNLDILKQQNKDIKNGTLYLHCDENGNKIKKIEIYKHDCMNRIKAPGNIQLARSGYNNKESKDIEEKFLHKKRERNYGVVLNHITDNLSDIKEYMKSCKLAYTNRVCISPDKNSINMDILEYVNYLNPEHIKAILYMHGNEISYENDTSIISYDITKAINILKEKDKLDDKDMYIIEGIRRRVTQDRLAEELKISKQAVNKRINKISNKIVELFKNEEKSLKSKFKRK